MNPRLEFLGLGVGAPTVLPRLLWSSTLPQTPWEARDFRVERMVKNAKKAMGVGEEDALVPVDNTINAALNRRWGELIATWQNFQSRGPTVYGQAIEFIFEEVAPWAAEYHAANRDLQWPEIIEIEAVLSDALNDDPALLRQSMERLFAGVDHFDDVAARLLIMFACCAIPEKFGKRNPWYRDRVQIYLERRFVQLNDRPNANSPLNGPATTASMSEAAYACKDQKEALSHDFRTVHYSMQTLEQLDGWVEKQRAEVESAKTVDAKPNRKPAGRKKADYETVQREAKIKDKWDQAREASVYKPDFAKGIGMDVKQFDKLLGRVARRESRSES